MRVHIDPMLADAFCQLGIKKVKDIDDLCRKAKDYLKKDRDRFVEVGEPDTPDYYITALHGVICRLIPLAREIITDEGEDCTRQYTSILYLMVTDSDARYALSYAHAKLYPDSSNNTYSFPVYHYTQLEDMRPTLQVLPPEEIEPPATALEWECFGMIFTAMAKFCRDLDISSIPHKTERAMLAVTHARSETLTVDGNTVTGKLVPLANETSLYESVREDHRYTYSKDLCLLISDGTPRYLLKTRHNYQYFRKVVYDDVPGGCSYKPTETKQVTTYQFVTLDEVQEKLYPLYY